jgi:hypothetical protein
VNKGREEERKIQKRLKVSEIKSKTEIGRGRYEQHRISE